MNSARKIIIVVSLLCLAATAFYPPWIYKVSGEKSVPMGYSFIWQPPVHSRTASADIFGLNINVKLQPVKANAVDLDTLLKNWLVIFGVAVVCYALTLLKSGSLVNLRRSSHGTAN